MHTVSHWKVYLIEAHLEADQPVRNPALKDAVRRFSAFACDNVGLGLPFVVSLYKGIWFVAAGLFSIISNIHVPEVVQ